MKPIKDIEEALKLFEYASMKHTEATEQGDYKMANKNYALIKKAVSFLVEHNERQRLLDILNHNSEGVRPWAATYLLPLFETDGLMVLKQIAVGKSITSFDAEMTIREWKNGNLRL